MHYFALTDKFDSHKDVEQYSLRSRSIQCNVDMEYTISMSLLYRKECTLQIKKIILKKADTFQTLNIPDFDIDSFKLDLTHFFNDYTANHTIGKELLRQKWDEIKKVL